MRDELSWDDWFMEIAQVVAKKSKDPSTKCGAVIVDSLNRLVSVGYNGFPRGTNDDPALYADREQKYPRVIHAEENALAFSYRDITGYTLYVTPFHPCGNCARMIVQRGVMRVVTLMPQGGLKERWQETNAVAIQLFEEAGVIVDLWKPPVTLVEVK